MSAITFDTLKFVERLEQAGVPRAQAAAIAEAQKDVFSAVMDASLATKSDVLTIRQDIDALRRDMKELEYRMTIKLGGLMMVAVGAVAALVKLL